MVSGVAVSSLPAAFRLDRRRALVTGGDAGIGAAIARTLSAAGARVAVGCLSGAEAAVSALGSGAIGIEADLGDRAALERLLATVEDKFGGLDILVLNAAVQVRAAWESLQPADVDRQIAVNLTATLRLTATFLPGMRDRGWGRLLAIGSVQQAKPHPDMPVYGALKAAQEHLVRNLARQLAPHGVTCNVLAPGVIDTPRSRPVLADPALHARVLAGIPAARIGLPEDCAGTALLLCSDAGAYITGATVPVDGGMSC